MKHYFDLDGTLADFQSEPNAIERYTTEPGFFANLKPTKLVERIKLLPTEIYILSTSPNEQADKDKVEWVKKHLPMVKLENIHLVRCNAHKSLYARGNVLYDDHTPNLLDWVENGGHAVKIINGHNNKQKRSKRMMKIKII